MHISFPFLSNLNNSKFRSSILIHDHNVLIHEHRTPLLRPPLLSLHSSSLRLLPLASSLAARSKECHGPGPEPALELPFAPPWGPSSSSSSSSSSTSPSAAQMFHYHHLHHEFKPSRWADLSAVEGWNPVVEHTGHTGCAWLFCWAYYLSSALWVYWA